MIWSVLLELLLGLGAAFIGLMGSIIGIGLLGDGNYTLMAIFVVIPLGVVTLVLALLYALRRPRSQRPLTWSLVAALLGAILLFGGLSFLGTINDEWDALLYLLALTLPAPLLQGLLSGGIAAIRRRRLSA
ncbi:MAG TPA: hypothetical protein VK191_16130 [Symbiobacteriaceae bacterium]|nr:hypothetical protein [Symbiobacteriaceae bacterium]